MSDQPPLDLRSSGCLCSSGLASMLSGWDDAPGAAVAPGGKASPSRAAEAEVGTGSAEPGPSPGIPGSPGWGPRPAPGGICCACCICWSSLGKSLCCCNHKVNPISWTIFLNIKGGFFFFQFKLHFHVRSRSSISRYKNIYICYLGRLLKHRFEWRKIVFYFMVAASHRCNYRQKWNCASFLMWHLAEKYLDSSVCALRCVAPATQWPE